jgi:hypothetical protein
MKENVRESRIDCLKWKFKWQIGKNKYIKCNKA